MEMTWSQTAGIIFALAMIAGFFWVVITYRTETVPTRLAQMLDRLGFGATDFNEWQIQLYMPTAARACRDCEHKAKCDAWLAKNRKAAAPPAFCANAGMQHFAAAVPWARAD